MQPVTEEHMKSETLAERERPSVEELKELSRKIRKSIIQMVHSAKSGHPGGALGLADIFTVLYFHVLNHDPQKPDLKDRDRLLLSNGHVSPVRYAAMAHAGYFPEEDLFTFRKLGSPLQGHPATRYIPAVENSSGSLGQGLSQATGLAMGLRHQNNPGRVYVGVSDGEMGEGMSWEAMQAAAHYKVPLIAFMDYNRIQIDGFIKDVLDLRDLAAKFESFGWKVIEQDGHDLKGIMDAFEQARSFTDGPVMILFHTILGKGVSFMENNPGWHGKAPGDEQKEQAIKEIEEG